MDSKILFFGSYNPNYSRNRILVKGLIRNDFKVLNCSRQGSLIVRYYKLSLYFIHHKSEFKNVIVGFTGQTDVILAWFLGKVFSKKIFFDIFTGKYETYVQDRKEIKSFSIKGFIYYLLDYLSIHLCDYLILDTKAHLDYFSKTFFIRKNKGIVIYLGSDYDFFKPVKLKIVNDVLFYGFFQPLHGTNLIIKAAKLLPKIKFKFVGHGQDKAGVMQFARKNKLKNVKFVNQLPLNFLANEINNSKIILGIFGKTTKANCVIPNKIYDGLACKKPVITSKTNAVRELLTDKKDCILLDKINAESLKDAIKLLLSNDGLRNTIANNGYKLFKNSLTPEQSVSPLFKYLI